MNNKIFLILILCSMLLGGPLIAQKTNKSKSAPTKIELTVLTPDGTPLSGVVASGNEGRITRTTDQKGRCVLFVPAMTPVMLECPGYADTLLTSVKAGDIRVKLRIQPLFSGKGNEVELPNGVVTDSRTYTGAVSKIDGASLISYPDPVVNNALAGRLTGLTVLQQSGEFGFAAPELYVRGYSSLNKNQALILVDGLERSLSDLMPEEIESITILKDAPAKLMYGARAANGVISVKTRKGEYNKRITRISVDYGVQLPTRMPGFLDSYDYATLYNEACLNDGLPALYDQAALDGYKKSSGANDLRYPNVDYYDYFLRKSATYRKITAEFIGGSDKARYSLVAGYIGGGGLEGQGKRSVADRFNIRGSLEVKLTPSITGRADLAGMLNLENTGDYTGSNLFGWLSSHRPNEYPLLLEGEEVNHQMYGRSIYGGSMLRKTNVLSEMVDGGYQVGRRLKSQTNVGFDIDMKQLVPGLKARAYITLDTHAYLQKGQNTVSQTYAPMWYNDKDGNEVFELVMLRDRTLQSDESVGTTTNRYNMGYYGGLSYGYASKSGHSVSADLSYSYFKMEASGRSQDIKNSNLVLRTNYGFRDKYFVEADVAMMGSSCFKKGNRQGFFPAVGLGWLISEEPFLKRSRTIDYLKLRASFGILGYDGSMPAYVYEQRWNNNGNIGFDAPNDISIAGVGSSYAGNPDLKWEKSREINVGIDLLLLNRKLGVTVDLFDALRYDIIQQVFSKYPQTAGHLLPYENWSKVASGGFEVDIHWRDRSGKFLYDLGLGISYSKSKIKKFDQVDDANAPLRSRIGTPADAIIGYIDRGLFFPGMDVNSYPRQVTGYYTTGDVRYADLNGDNVVDDLDRTLIGNTIPRTVLSLSANLRYKGFGLYILGTANLGFDKLQNNTYYQNFGNNKYSDLAVHRYHPVNNPGGRMPRLSTTDNRNNTVASSFWLENSDFFKLKNVELSYTFTPKGASPLIGNLKAYVRGTNLWCVSAIKDLDPEDIGAGIGNYPLFTTLTLGVSVTF